MSLYASIFNGRVRGAVELVRVALDLLQRFKDIDFTSIDQIRQHGMAIVELIRSIFHQITDGRTYEIAGQAFSLAGDMRSAFGGINWDNVTAIADVVRQFVKRILDFIRDIQGIQATALATSDDETSALAMYVASSCYSERSGEAVTVPLALFPGIGSGLLQLLPIVLEIVRYFFPRSDGQAAESQAPAPAGAPA